MKKYVESMGIGDIKVGDIVIIAKSVQKGIHRIGIVTDKPNYCLPNLNDDSFYSDSGIHPSSENPLIKLFKEKIKMMLFTLM